ncbi:MAG: hypothetical protein EPN88_05260 [Bacteroidetes bacterium]|nr:MAG: hypothetical protein EPN88_05260 [Bacteroidota bacterium]
MKWRKLGHIYQPSGIKRWARSHAANPVAENVEGDYFRIYFSTRDEHNQSSIGYVVININEPNKVLEESEEPVLMPGDIGMFDDSGVSIGCIVPVGESRYLYYMGWNLAVTVPWKNTIGLAVSEAIGEPFKRYSGFPIIGLDEVNPYTISYPWVVRESGSFRMWYGSNLKWGPQKSDMLHVIKYAESGDGIHWKKDNRIAINSESPEEYAICKPCVLKDETGYLMWFCSRGNKYRIHLAKSTDGINWERLGKDPGIDISESGWDSEMIEYPCIFDHKGYRYMLYAGNGYGRTGFGIAVLETK